MLIIRYSQTNDVFLLTFKCRGKVQSASFSRLLHDCLILPLPFTHLLSHVNTVHMENVRLCSCPGKVAKNEFNFIQQYCFIQTNEDCWPRSWIYSRCQSKIVNALLDVYLKTKHRVASGNESLLSDSIKVVLTDVFETHMELLSIIRQ